MVYMNQHLKVPKDALRANVNGRVSTSFVVNKNGSISEVKIVKSLFPSVDSACLKFLREMPDWEPGSQNGNPVRVRMNMPIIVNTEWAIKSPFSNKKQVIKRKPRKVGQGFEMGLDWNSGRFGGTFGQNLGGYVGALDIGFGWYRNQKWMFSVHDNIAQTKITSEFTRNGRVFPEGGKLSLVDFSMEANRTFDAKPRHFLAPYAGIGYGILSEASENSAFGIGFLMLRAGLIYDYYFSETRTPDGFGHFGNLDFGLRFRAGGDAWLGRSQFKNGPFLGFGIGLVMKNRACP